MAIKTLTNEETGESAPAHQLGTTADGKVIYRYVEGWRPNFPCSRDKDGNWVEENE